MLVETQYLTNSRRLVVSYVDKTGYIKLKYYNLKLCLELCLELFNNIKFIIQKLYCI